MRLNVKAFGLAGGLFWGVGLFLITWWILLIGSPAEQPNIFTLMYPGYRITALGSLIGLVWGFIDGLVCGLIFSWLYNLLADRFSAKG